MTRAAIIAGLSFWLFLCLTLANWSGLIGFVAGALVAEKYRSR